VERCFVTLEQLDDFLAIRRRHDVGDKGLRAQLRMLISEADVRGCFGGTTKTNSSRKITIE